MQLAGLQENKMKPYSEQSRHSTLVVVGVFLILVLAMCTGCSTVVPVVAKFPEPPKYTQACPQLQKLNNETKLSDVASTVNINYTTYYECAVKVDAWNEWYEIQRRIFENVK